MSEAPADGIPRYTIRPMRTDDVGATLELVFAFYEAEGFTTPHARLTRNLARLAEAEGADVRIAVHDDGTAIAFAVSTCVIGLEHGIVAELQDLYVDPRYRRAGIAGALINAAAAWARQRDAEVLDVVVDTEGDARHGLTRYYQQHGFVDGGRRILTAPLD